ncbi:hypothetical protein thsps21_54730 [Pseudomonas sp. No.21]|uniref:hypothetical protein n=1 Tax=Pseudomonas tohonis TaxID=2725477 RepID=UPI001F3F250E|nr:hypothetical protein [Pseudomonas tohonis]GJN48976.1 hypothetical protein TUM20249_49620 [Pseudomonas tohonis]
MRPSIALLLPALYCTALAAGELDGRYQANLDGQPTELVLRQDGQAVQGLYVENGSLQLDLAGSFDGQVLRAEISVPQSGQVVATLAARYADAQLATRIAARDPRSGQVLEREALFRRASQANSQAQASAGDLDPALVGNWVHEKIINSGGGSGFASFNTVMTLRLGADGSVAQWARSTGGGGDWSYDSPGELQYSGQWRSDNGVLLVRQQGAADFQPAARYRFSDPYLVTEGTGGKMIWQRR